jgi:hypothetical protein
VHFDVGQVAPQPPDPDPADQLTVVQFNPLEVVAQDQVIKGGVRDERQVV